MIDVIALLRLVASARETAPVNVRNDVLEPETISNIAIPKPVSSSIMKSIIVS